MLCTGSFLVYGQEEDTLTFEEVMAYDFNDFDTLSFLSIIDSLVQLEALSKKSTILFTLAYNSELTSAGRDLELNQPGYSSGVSYYHHTGLYGNASLFYNSAYSRTHYLTTATIGYLGFLGKSWMYGASFDKLFYHDGDSSYYHPLENSLNAGIYFQPNWLNIDLDYSFYFGEESGHQIMPSLSGNFSLKNIWVFDQISFMPQVTMLFGSSTITNIIPQPRTRLCAFRRFRQRFPELCFILDNEERFGLLNYGFSLPFQLNLNSFSLGASYNYNLPKSLEGETVRLDPYGFFRFWLTYQL